MKKRADMHRSERVFEVGDLVFLKLQPYVQTSLAPRAHQKLAFKFFGPYRIMARLHTSWNCLHTLLSIRCSTSLN